jgi:hypothetical protein
MTSAQSATSAPILDSPIPIRELLPWTLFGLVLAAILIYFVGAEGGATALTNGPFAHELTHDGRHLLGFPCH